MKRRILLMAIVFVFSAVIGINSNSVFASAKTQVMSKQQAAKFIYNAERTNVDDPAALKYTEKTIGKLHGYNIPLNAISGKYEKFSAIEKIYSKYYTKELVPYAIANSLSLYNVNGIAARVQADGDGHLILSIKDINVVSVSRDKITAKVYWTASDGDKYDKPVVYILKSVNRKWLISSIDGNTKLKFKVDKN